MPNPPPPCVAIDSVNITLLKQGLNAAGRAYLAARPNLKSLPDHGLFVCSPTRMLVLNSWEGDVTVGTLTEKMVFNEVPDALVVDGTTYRLVTKIQVGPSTTTYQGEWNPGASQIIDDAAGQYGGSDYIGVICWGVTPTSNAIKVVSISDPLPLPEAAPMPAPALGSEVEINRRAAGIVSGVALLTDNQDGTYYFTATIQWKHPIQGPCACWAVFTAYHVMQGMISNLIDVTGTPQPVGASIEPAADPSYCLLKTGRFDANRGDEMTLVFTATFEGPQ